MAVTRRTLSAQERRVVELIAEGLDTEDIAEEMFLSRSTVRSKIKTLRALVGGETMTDLPALVAEYEKE